MKHNSTTTGPLGELLERRVFERRGTLAALLAKLFLATLHRPRSPLQSERGKRLVQRSVETHWSERRSALFRREH